MKIVILDGAALNPGDLSWDCFRQFGLVTLYPQTGSAADAITRIGDAEVILLNKVPITEQVLSACPNLRLICVLATGYNVVDCQAAAGRGITVCNVPKYSTDSVAQFTIALLLELCHRIGHHNDAVQTGRWSDCPNFCFWDTPQMELAGKTMGIIGFGSIGQKVALIAKALGMRVLAYSRTRRPEASRLADHVSLDTLLEESDVVSLHCPLFPETEGLIDRSALDKMKPGAILLNTARGPILDENAVAEALRSGKLRGAAMDVVSREPISPDNPLLHAPNCILTPHMAWSPIETRRRILDITMENIRRFLDADPQNVVNEC